LLLVAWVIVLAERYFDSLEMKQFYFVVSISALEVISVASSCSLGSIFVGRLQRILSAKMDKRG